MEMRPAQKAPFCDFAPNTGRSKIGAWSIILQFKCNPWNRIFSENVPKNDHLYGDMESGRRDIETYMYIQ
jgi:hypothetical protein